MGFNGEQYYKINKILLASLGLWPSQNIQIQPIFFFTLFFSFLFVQLCMFITSKYNMTLTLDVLSHFLPALIYTVQYNVHYINAKKIKLLMDKIQNDWNTLNDKKEIEIIEKYASTMNVYTTIFTLFTCVCLIAFIFMEVFPIILDIVVPLNESRPRNLHVLAEYFVDREKYFPLMLLHELLACFAGAITILATGTIIMAYEQHVCGMLKIVSFRIEHLLEKNMLQYSRLQIERIICDKIIRAVDLHRKAVKFHDLILSSFMVPYLILIIIGVASISLNLYRLLQLSIMKNTTSLITCIILLSGHFLFMFLGNYVGQVTTDHSVDVFNVTCNVLWYIAPLSSQKMLLFLMHRTMKSLNLTICNVFVASLEGFAALSTTSLSYVTVIYSLQYQ